MGCPMPKWIPQRRSSHKQVPRHDQIKGYINTLRILSVAIAGIAVFCLLSQSEPQWLLPFGLLLAGIGFIIMGIVLREYPALAPSFLSFLTKRSRHSKEDNCYDKKDNR